MTGRGLDDKKIEYSPERGARDDDNVGIPPRMRTTNDGNVGQLWPRQDVIHRDPEQLYSEQADHVEEQL